MSIFHKRKSLLAETGTNIVRKKTCYRCSGSGVVIDKVNGKGLRETCPICNGLGRIR